MPTNSRSKLHRITFIDPYELEKSLNEGAKAANHNLIEDLKRSLELTLEAGDHIAATRRNGMYEHHGIYAGTERGYPSVIHLQGPVTLFVKDAGSLLCISKCGYCHPKKGGRVVSCLHCFTQGKEMFKIQYMLDKELVSNQDPNWSHLEDGKVIAGYCSKKYYLEHFMDGKLYGHSLVPEEKLQDYTLEDQVRFYEMPSERSGNEVLDVARETEVKPYSLGCNNCEHFAVFCKTGLWRSIQVENFPIPVVCENGKRVCRCQAKGMSIVQNGQENMNQEKQGSLELYKKWEKKNKEKKMKKKSWLCVPWNSYKKKN